MQQTQWILIFMTSIFASGISSAISKTINMTVLQHLDGLMAKRTVATTRKYEREKMTSGVKTSSELPEYLRNKMSLENEKEAKNSSCHLTDEAKDMLDCIVPLDEAKIQPTANPSHEISTAANRTEQETSFSFNDTYPPKIFPHDKNVKNIEDADEETRKRLNLTLYTTSDEIQITDTSSVIGINKKNNEKNTNATISLMNNRNDIQSTASGNNVEVTAQKSVEGMSWRMIMLTMMLTCVASITIIYVSVIVWKRYLEYKCNDRQLLDNDSEFDTNDLHHFEL